MGLDMDTALSCFDKNISGKEAINISKVKPVNISEKKNVKIES